MIYKTIFYAIVYFLLLISPSQEIRDKLLTLEHTGKTTATRSVMKTIRSALIEFKQDFGRYPYTSEPYSPITINLADKTLLSEERNKNVLCLPTADEIERLSGPLNRDKYATFLYLPYLDKDCEMLDKWGNKIKYSFFKDGVFLFSSGPDGIFDNPEFVIQNNYQGDDLFEEVGKIEFDKKE